MGHGVRRSSGRGFGAARHFANFIWETLPATPAQHATTFDFDGDGANNLNEWLALTDAANPASLFRITQIFGTPGDLFVSFPSVVGRRYHLEESTDLANWTPILSNLPGTGNVINVHLGRSEPRYFLRARVGP